VALGTSSNEKGGQVDARWAVSAESDRNFVEKIEVEIPGGNGSGTLVWSHEEKVAGL